MHEKDNKTVFNLLGKDTYGPFPDENIINDTMTAWKTNIEDVIRNDLGELYDKAKDRGEKAAGELKNCKKNPFFITGQMKYAYDEGCRFDTLNNVVDKILSSAQKNKNLENTA